MSDLFPDISVPAEEPMAIPDLDMPMPESIVSLVSSAPSETLTPIITLLPPEFRIPELAKPVIDLRYIAEADAHAARLRAMVVNTGDDCVAADAAIAVQRTYKLGIEAQLEDFIALTHGLHKWGTTKRGEYTKASDEAIKAVGVTVSLCLARLRREAEEEQRKRQEDADTAERARLQREADIARRQGQVAVAKAIEQDAATAMAPPVALATTPTLAHSTTQKSWKIRMIACGCETEGHCRSPEVHEQAVRALLAGILERKDPIAAIKVDWTYLGQRARADEKTLNITGFEVWEASGLKSRPGRR